MKEILNLIDLSKHDPDLGGILVEGMVNEFIEFNGEIEFTDKFKLTDCLNYNITYQNYYWKKVHYCKRKTKRHQQYKLDIPVRILNKSIMTIVASKRIYELWSKLNSYKLLKVTPVIKGSLNNLNLKNFRLRYWTYLDYTHCKIQVKYKQSLMSNKLFKHAYNEANWFPHKNSYVDLISFNTEHSEPDKLLLYLHQILKI